MGNLLKIRIYTTFKCKSNFSRFLRKIFRSRFQHLIGWVISQAQFPTLSLSAQWCQKGHRQDKSKCFSLIWVCWDFRDFLYYAECKFGAKKFYSLGLAFCNISKKILIACKLIFKGDLKEHKSNNYHIYIVLSNMNSDHCINISNSSWKLLHLALLTLLNVFMSAVIIFLIP